MTLATRCTACGTAFRVVEDQLKVSEGWVRCGSCGEVFSGLDALFDLEYDTPAVQQPALPGVPEHAQEANRKPRHLDPNREALSTGAPAELDRADPTRESARADADSEAASADPAGEPVGGNAVRELPSEHSVLDRKGADTGVEPESADAVGVEARPVARRPAAATDSADAAAATEVRDSRSPVGEPDSTSPEGDGFLDERIDAHLFGVRRTAGRGAPATHLSERDRLDFSDARFDSDLMTDEELLDVPPQPAGLTAPGDLPLEVAAAPEFVRRAERRARWQRPSVHLGLALGAMTLGIALALQAAHHFRDVAAVRWPGLQPVLAQWCAIAACTIEPPRRIEDLSVESTALAKAAGTEAFRLAVALRSKSRVPVALPWIDLSLTDASGKLVARKALAAREFKPASLVLEPGAEVVLQTLLSARNTQVTGYTVEIFYP